MQLLGSRDSWWMKQADAILEAEGLQGQWQASPTDSGMVLDVATSEAERASDALSALLGEELGRRRVQVGPRDTRPLWQQPAFTMGLGMAALTVVLYLRIGGSGPEFARGMLVLDRAFLEPWRLITAATLHADWQHALGNAAFFVVLGWAASERLGTGVAAALWLMTAVVGFATSYVFSDAMITVGASGGLYGLLGAAMGHGLRTPVPVEQRRHHILRMLGGGVLLLAMTAFSERANVSAHVGGFVAGVFAGLALPGLPLPRWAQRGLAALVIGLVFFAWSLARRL